MPPTPSQPEPELKVNPEPTGLEKDLIDRGVSRGVAAELVRDVSEERIRAQIERADWLRETKPKRIKDLGAYLAKAIREDYAAPAGFEGRVERAARETAQREAIDREAEARQSKARAARSRRGSRRTGRTAPGAAGRARGRGVGPGPIPPTAPRTRRRRRPPGVSSWSASETP